MTVPMWSLDADTSYVPNVRLVAKCNNEHQNDKYIWTRLEKREVLAQTLKLNHELLVEPYNNQENR